MVRTLLTNEPQLLARKVKMSTGAIAHHKLSMSQPPCKRGLHLLIILFVLNIIPISLACLNSKHYLCAVNIYWRTKPLLLLPHSSRDGICPWLLWHLPPAQYDPLHLQPQLHHRTQISSQVELHWWGCQVAMGRSREATKHLCLRSSHRGHAAGHSAPQAHHPVLRMGDD